MITRIGILANPDKPQLLEVMTTLLAAAKEAGLGVVVSSLEARALDLEALRAPEEDLPGQVDAVVSLGGDGTFLRAARVVGDTGTPILGINLGGLGFLADVRREGVAEAVDALVQGNYTLERRRKVAVTVQRGGVDVFETAALNDVVLNMGDVPRAIDMEVTVEDVRVGRYLADGLIVATPTGSTAYSLSAGGPIVDTGVEAVVVTPICPHTLAVRPMILPDRKSLHVRLCECPSGVISGDGQVSFNVGTGDELVYHRAPEVCYLIRLPGRTLYQVIQEKLKWGGHPRHMDSIDAPGAEV